MAELCLVWSADVHSRALGDAYFAVERVDKWRGGANIQLGCQSYPRRRRATAPSINAQHVTAATWASSIAVTAGGSADVSAWVDSARRATSLWPSVICYLNTPSLPTVRRGQGPSPFPPEPSYPLPAAPDF
jgi:hypothetical protein